MAPSALRRSCQPRARLLSAVVIVITVLACAARYSSAASGPLVTCGSSVKLLHPHQDVRLHSHEVQYGSGSGQQSVTGVKSADDVNSYWVVRGQTGDPCIRGEPVKCGSGVRLQHLQTKRNLHSHIFVSPLSRNQEVSCFGEDGNGDTGDHWTVLCSGKNWLKDSKVQFKHVDTSKYLYVSGQKFNRPIAGQFEISATDHPSGETEWKVMEGVLIQPTQKK